MLYGANEAVIEFVFDILDLPAPENAAAIGTEIDGELVGGVVYSGYTAENVYMSCAGTDPRWLSREKLRHYFGYPFIQLGCLRVTALIEKGNKRSRRMVEGLGFKHEGTHPRMVGGRDALSYGMLRENCRWCDG